MLDNGPHHLASSGSHHRLKPRGAANLHQLGLQSVSVPGERPAAHSRTEPSTRMMRSSQQTLGVCFAPPRRRTTHTRSTDILFSCTEPAAPPLPRRVRRADVHFARNPRMPADPTGAHSSVQRSHCSEAGFTCKDSGPPRFAPQMPTRHRLRSAGMVARQPTTPSVLTTSTGSWVPKAGHWKDYLTTAMLPANHCVPSW